MAKLAAATYAEVNDLDLPAMTAQQQKLDSQLKSIINTIEAGQTRAGYKLQDSLIVYVGPQRIVLHLCVPISNLPAVFHNIHNNSGHFSFAKTSLQLASIHHPCLSSSLQMYINNCPQFASSIGIKLKPSAPYHQQANPMERHIQTLQHVLCALAVEYAKDWVNILPAAKLAINSTPSLTTRQAPFDLVYIA
ncbi:hypothetical protein NDA13_003061 [Ustilago tritici]|nr:hypothetical protein NDA13_003061 [Ustilago tritici]